LVPAGAPAYGGCGGTDSYPTFDGVFVHSGFTNPTAAVFHAPQSMSISEIKLWSEMIGNGLCQTPYPPANGFDVTVNSVISGVTNKIGSFIFTGPPMVEAIYTPSIILQTGDMIEILYGNNGDVRYDHGNVNVFISANPAVPITVYPYSDEYVIMVGTEYDISSGKLFYIPSNKDGTFGSVSEVADIGYRAGAGIADFDNDGDLDFVAGAREDYSGVANFYLFKNGGNGNFVKYLIASDIPCLERVGTFAVADFNEDGFKDFVVPINLSYDIYLFTNNGANAFTVSKLEPLSPGAAKEGDFNEDGHMDFVITDYFNAKVYLYEGDGNGGFTKKFLFDVFGNYEAEQITVGDFNEDGHLDIIVDDFMPYGGGGHLYLGDGTGNFTFGSTVYSRPVNGAWTYGVDSFDFGKDGHRDLILSSYEYPPTGLVFIMKGNGDGTFQDAEKIDMEPLGSVFPVTPSLGDVTPPVLSLPNDMTVECAGPQGKVVTFVAQAIDDIDGQVPVTCTPASGSSFPLGATQVTCIASDVAGNTATGTFTVTINDTMGPAIQGLIATPDVLWPPNHKMVPVSVVVQASDTCDPNPICTITSVSSNEPDNGLGDGDTSPDWEFADNLTANLRSERSGEGSGRIYTITVQCMDSSLNTSVGTVNVSVPHDLGKKK
jgi:hypothetical protein